MTTIAYKDGVLAADTLSTWGDSRDGHAIKIAKRGPFMAAGSGCLAHVQAFLDWFKGGMKADPPPMGEGEKQAFGFIFVGDGKFLTWGALGWEQCRDDVFAAGSGSEFAKGAMSHGASAEEAVRIAITHDTKSGGKVTVLRSTPIPPKEEA
jgi:hypothetical protein